MNFSFGQVITLGNLNWHISSWPDFLHSMPLPTQGAPKGGSDGGEKWNGEEQKKVLACQTKEREDNILNTLAGGASWQKRDQVWGRWSRNMDWKYLCREQNFWKLEKYYCTLISEPQGALHGGRGLAQYRRECPESGDIRIFCIILLKKLYLFK